MTPDIYDNKKILSIIEKAELPLAKALAESKRIQMVIQDSIRREQDLIRSLAVGKAILIKQIIDHEVELYNLLLQQQRDLMRLKEYENNIAQLEKSEMAARTKAKRYVNNEIRIEENDAELLERELLAREQKIKSVAKRIANMEVEVFQHVPKEMYDEAKKLLKEGKFTAEKALECAKDVIVEAKDLKELDKWIERESRKP